MKYSLEVMASLDGEDIVVVHQSNPSKKSDWVSVASRIEDLALLPFVASVQRRSNEWIVRLKRKATTWEAQHIVKALKLMFPDGDPLVAGVTMGRGFPHWTERAPDTKAMRVDLGTIEVDDDCRRELAKALGKRGLASRKDVREAVLKGGLDVVKRAKLKQHKVA